MADLSSKERRDWLRLIRTPGIGPITFYELLKRCDGKASEAIKRLPELSIRAGRRQRLHAVSVAAAEGEIEACLAYGASIVCLPDPGFPTILKTLQPPPPVLTILGDEKLFSRPCLAMVGTRNASAMGLSLAADIAVGLGQASYVIASGLARGIDAQAHRAALETGTIGVLAGGINHIYPQEHEDLYWQIAQKGAIISESAFDYRAVGHDFPRRNRLVTGLARGVVVIEATNHSGSLISARLALSQNREVMAVPGSPLDARSAGTNRLIRSGAHLVETAEDVLEVCPLDKGRLLDKDEAYTFEEDVQTIPISQSVLETVYGLLSATPVHMDQIVQAANIPTRQASAALAELELAGRASSLAGGMVCRVMDHHLAERS